ncbi:RsfA family transcriptional regulator [Bacillus sp. 31A1R]|uniref:RsfA family transcriptional regulator n=1 Tax=Robertmurraya mangrovi TaxID=3098077 RepID=A0ABU5IU62_9BACI|nr:RsfA family transcriptional regulator [Bacillus sp. 31A1R]MDZ5470684.1 RsfA family transcriptional regulator [Bacillus sp. 31A1R]
MPTNRQDAWSQDEDILLAEVVLRHIREGGTQLQAFEEVGRQLSRTSAACGFRWNSYVRKQYKSAIELAKKQRKELKKNTHLEEVPIESQEKTTINDPAPEPVNHETRKLAFSYEELAAFIKELYNRADESNGKKEEIQAYEGKIQGLEKQIFYLAAENEKLAKEKNMIEEDYKALIEIMERARKMVVLQEEDRQQKVKFQMDRNGNLERIEK